MTVATRPEGALVKNDPLQTPLGQMIEPYRAQLAPFLRDGVTLERVAAELVLASRKTPHLDECHPVELVDAVSRALDTGGMIGRDVFIVPFKNSKRGVYEPSVITHYKFDTELVVQAGGARSIDAFPVYEDELGGFSYTAGSNPRIEHSPSLKPPAQRKLVGAYAVAFMGFNHTPKIRWVPLAEVEQTRAKSKEWNPQKIAACPPWYACKTAVKRLVGLLPKNPKLRRVLDLLQAQDRAEFDEDADVTLVRPSSVDPDGVDLEYTGQEAGSEDMPTDVEPPTPPARVDRDLAWAMGYTIPGKPESWGGHGGTELGVAPLSVVSGVQAWAAKQMEKPDGYAKADELEAAATIVLQARTEAEEAEEAEQSVLPLGDTKAAKRSRNAVSEGH